MSVSPITSAGRDIARSGAIFPPSYVGGGRVRTTIGGARPMQAIGRSLAARADVFSATSVHRNRHARYHAWNRIIAAATNGAMIGVLVVGGVTTTAERLAAENGLPKCLDRCDMAFDAIARDGGFGR